MGKCVLAGCRQVHAATHSEWQRRIRHSSKGPTSSPCAHAHAPACGVHHVRCGERVPALCWPGCAALVFKGIGFFDVGVAVLTRRLGWLADRIVPCGPRQARRSREEWVELLRYRLRPAVL